jgi:PAS domain S-box-containing protein
VPDLIIFKDAQRRYTHVNRATCQLFDLAEADVIGKSIEDFEGAEEPSRRGANEEAVLASGLLQADQVEKMVLRDGSVHWFSTSRAPLRGQAGAIVGLAVIARDVTERIRAEDERHAATERFRKVIELAGDGIVAVDEHYRITLFNQAAERIFGYTADEVLRQPLNLLLPSEVATSDRETIATFEPSLHLSGAASGRSPGHGWRKNGEEFRAETTISKFVENGNTAYIVVVRDVTRRLEMQEHLAQSQKMEALGSLTGGIAHDFNNLLTIIIGNLELLLDGVAASNRDMRELIEQSITAALSGAELSTSLLAFSRRQTLKAERIDVVGLVNQQVKLLGRMLGRDINVDVNEPDEICWTIADANQLRCAFMNLVLNSRDAMPNGGTLSIGISTTTLGSEELQEGAEPGEFVCVDVSDTGIGIPQELIRRIFDPFFTTKEIGKGTGLGLSMVYGFVKQTGGVIRVCSEVGKGTTFRLHLPRAKPIVESNNATEAA